MGWALFDVLDLFAHLLDQHLHVNRNAGHLQHGRLGAQGVGLAVQLLNQEVQAFADVAALGEQARNLVQMRAQTGQLFGYVDADGKSGGLGQGPVLGRLWQVAAVGQGHGVFPAFQKALALLLDQLGHQGAGQFGQSAQLANVALQHLGQAGAFAGACFSQGLHRLGGHLHPGGFVGGGLAVAACAHAQHIGHAQLAGFGQPVLDLVLQGRDFLQGLVVGRLQDGPVGAVLAGTHFDFAAFDLAGDQLAQPRLELAQFFGQAKTQVQEAAVDRADFKPQAGRWRCAGGGFPVHNRRAVLHAGVAGHTVN